MDQAGFLRRLEAERLVSIIRGIGEEEAAEAGQALVDAGIGVIEVAFSWPGARGVLRALGRLAEKGAVLGAGTVTDESTLEAALQAGARFIVTPHLAPRVIRACVARGIPAIPGAFSPTEVMQGFSLGACAVKVFPASALGPGYVRALLGPYPGLRLVPTGGIGPANAADYLAAGAFAVGVGAGLFPEEGGWPGAAVVGERAAELVRKVTRFRAAAAAGRSWPAPTNREAQRGGCTP
ncbi:MAG: bifunctional 4-hydroxy-2-oxoglutarate aldolase/2-dehydro-3-deoxy-phosphogluconate aldolase [Acetobacteraceae bacterium]|nr:bifunctional 4-hydroxy-2-oxoglutarate aldolase/2-dehydro-3-deoxy-phosphogluconate aldolase [Acetobacteraceae bacterium]